MSRGVFRSWLGQWRAINKKRTDRARTGKRARRCELTLEHLETRELLTTGLAITPITWNVLGLDSNNVNVGPNRFPVGVRVTNTGSVTATNVQTNLVWDSSNSFFNLRAGSSPIQTLASLAAGATADFYYDVDVTRSSSVYNTARRFHLTATDAAGDSATTPNQSTLGLQGAQNGPRELFAEHLISQSRNGIDSISGPTTVYVGQTYQFTLNSHTAPGGYEQLSTFLTLPGPIFQVQSLSASYTQPATTINTIYADAAGWDNNPLDTSTYRSVVGPTPAMYVASGGKTGAQIQSVFTVKVLAPGTQQVTALIQDFSGSSFHYNADYGSVVLSVTAIDPAPVAANDAATMNEDTPAVIDVTANDTAPGASLDPTTVTIVAGQGPAHGTVSINPVTGAITYTPFANYSGPDSFQYTVKDSAGTVSNVATVSLTVRPIDDAPVNALPAIQPVLVNQITASQTAGSVLTGGTGIQISDVDAGTNAVRVTLTATNGTLTLPTTTNLLLLAGTGSGDTTVTVQGKISDINTALSSLTFNPTLNYLGAASIQITTDDLGNSGTIPAVAPPGSTITDGGTALSTTNTLALTVTQVDQPPANTVPGAQSMFAGGTLAFSGATQISVNDIDASGGIEQVRVTVAHGTVSLNTAGVSVTSGASGTADVTFRGTLAALNSALASLVYTPTASYTGSDTLTLTTDDLGHTGSIPTTAPAGSTITDGGTALSTSSTVSIQVVGLDQAPVITAPSSVTFNQNTTFNFTNTISVNDVDAGTSPIQLSLSVNSGTISLGSIPSTLVFIVGNGTNNTAITIFGPQADIVTALTNLKYTPPANTTGTATLTINANDLGNTGIGGPLSAVQKTVTLNITPVNIAPVNTVPGTTQSVESNKSLDFSSTNGNAITINDVNDIPTSTVITVTLSVPPPASGPVPKLTATATAGAGSTVPTVSGSGTNSITITGSIVSVNATLNTLNYNPNNQNPGIVPMSVVTDDLGNPSFGAANHLTASSTVNLNVFVTSGNPADIDPTVAVPGAQSTSRGTPITFSSANVNTITVGDIDVGTSGSTHSPNTEHVRLKVTNGTLTLASTTGLSSVTGNISAQVDFDGTLGNMNAAINGLIYTPNSGATSDTLQVFIDDLGNSGTFTSNATGGLPAGRVATASVNITIGSTDVAPTNNVPLAQVMPENAPGAPTSLTFSSGNSNLVSITDRDSASTTFTVTLTVGHGTLSVNTPTGGTRTGNNSSNVTLTGTVANINTVLNGLVYTPTSEYFGPDSLSITSNDGDGTGSGPQQTGPTAVSITVTPIDAAPVNHLPAAPTTNDLTPITFSSANGNAITINDEDAELTAGTVKISLSVDQNTTFGDHGTLALVNTGAAFVTVLGGAGSTASPLQLEGTVANLNAVLNAGLRYTPAIGAYTATIKLVTDDQGNTGSGGPLSATNTLAITVTHVHLPPTLDLNGPATSGINYTASFTETNAVFTGTGPVLIVDGSNLSLTTSDSATISSATITLTNHPDGAAESLSAIASGGITVNAYNSSTGVLSLTGVASVTAYQTVLRTVKYNNTSNNPNTTNRTVNFVVTDSLGLSTATAVSTVHVIPADDPPVNKFNGAAFASQNVIGTEDNPILFMSANNRQLSLDDVDAGNATVQVTLTATNGTLTLGGSTTNITFVAGTGTSDTTLIMQGTKADLNTALSTVTFNPASNYNGSATITMVSNDLGNTGLGGPLTATSTINLSVSAVDDPPVNTVPGPQTATENTPFVFSTANGNALSVFDVDADPLAVQVTLTVSHGTLTVGTPAGGTASGSGTSNVTLTGTQASINAVLNGLQYNPTTNYFGPATLTILTDDLGHTGSGGPRQSGSPEGTPDPVAITVEQLNDTPTITSPTTTLTINEDTPLTFSSSSNLVMVGDGDAGPTSIRVTLSAADGKLTLHPPTNTLTFSTGSGTNDTTMSFTGSITDINIALNGLTYTPTLNFNGPTYLTVAVDDLGNTGTGGPKTAFQYILITVNPVNDKPTADNKTATLAENSSTSVSLTGSDVETPASALIITITSLPAHGTLKDASNNPVGLNQTFVGSPTSLTYTPNANYNGPDSFTYTTTDTGDPAGTPGNVLTSDPATVSLTVTPVNSAPTANNVNTTTPPNTPKTINLTGTDVETPAGALVFTITSLPTHGTLKDASNNPVSLNQTFTGSPTSLTYTPNTNYTGPDSFTYTVTDTGDPVGTPGNVLTSSTATVSITVSQANTAPTANSNSYTTPENTVVSVALSGSDTETAANALVFTVTSLPAHGTLKDAGNNPASVNQTFTGSPTSLTYTPNANYNGSDSFTYTVTDTGNPPGTPGNALTSAAATDSITITAVNSPPTANSNSYTTPENTAVTVALSGSDVETPAGVLVFTITSLPTHGTLKDASNNPVSVNQTFTGSPTSLTYTPNTNYNGSDSFTYTVTDTGDPVGTPGNALTSTTATDSITITAVNSPPTATSNSYTTPENTAVSVALSGSDTETPANALKFTITSLPSHGTLKDASNNPVSVNQTFTGSPTSLTYTPNANYNGADSFTYTVTDTGDPVGTPGNALTSTTATDSITITAVNSPPSANSNSYTTPENTAVTVALSGSDIETPAGALVFTITSLPTHGTLKDAGNNPVSVNQTFTGSPTSLTYTPNANYNGSDSFTYTVTDTGDPVGTAGNVRTSAAATDSITITAVNSPPTATSHSYTTPENTAVTVALSGSDTETPASALVFTVTSLPSHGTLKDASNNPVSVNQTFTGSPTSLTYTPNANYNGADSFTYTVTDTGDPVGTAGNVLTSAAATDSITITPVNSPPSANSNGYTTPENTAVTVALSGSDIETPANALKFTITSLPTHGTLKDASNNPVSLNQTFTGSPTSLTYTPNTNYNGSDSFTYTVTDTGDPVGTPGNALTSTTATDSITITAVNSPPTANSNSYTTPENTAVSVALSGSDTETPANALVFTVTSLPAHGTLKDASNNPVSVNQTFTGSPTSLTYTPNANYNGSDSFTYTVTDTGDPIGTPGNALTSTTATDSITISAVNSPPTANSNSYTTAVNTAVAVTLSGSDTETPANALKFTITSLPTHGTLKDAGNNPVSLNQTFTGSPTSLTYTPNNSYSGSDSFTYTVTDTGDPVGTPGNALTSSSATDSITITAPTAPVVDLNGPGAGINYVATFTEKQPAVLIVDGSTLTVTGSANPTLASATITLTNILDAGLETLSVNTAGTSLVTSYSGATGVLTLTGPATPADFQTVLRTLAYNNTSVNPNPTDRLVTFKVDDGTGTAFASNSPLAVSTVHVIPVDDAPVLNLPAAQCIGPAGRIFSTGRGDAITVGDVDAAGAVVQLQLQVDQGTLTLGTTANVSIVAGSNGSANLTLRGTLANLNTALNGLNYQPGSFIGTATLTLTADDLGNTGTGGPKSTTGTLLITVVAPQSLTRTATFNLQYTNWTNSLTLPQFDPSLGTLLSVQVIQQGNLSVRLKVENTSRSSASMITATGGAQLSLSGPGFTNLIVLPTVVNTFNATIFDSALNYAGTSGKDFGPQTATASNSITLIDAASLAQYIGAGLISFTDVATTTTKVTSNAGNLASSTSTLAGAGITLIYVYLPPGCSTPQRAASEDGTELATAPVPDELIHEQVGWDAQPGTSATVRVFVDPRLDATTVVPDEVIDADLAVLNQTASGLHVVRVAQPDQADIVVRQAATSPLGGRAQGILGSTTFTVVPENHGFAPDGRPYYQLAGQVQITILTGWTWYVGTSTGVPAGSYDYATVLLHELGHAVGLDHDGDDTSAMDESLPAGTARRRFDAAEGETLRFLYGSAGLPAVEAVQDAASAPVGQPSDVDAFARFAAFTLEVGNRSSGQVVTENSDAGHRQLTRQVLDDQARDLLFAGQLAQTDAAATLLVPVTARDSGSSEEASLADILGWAVRPLDDPWRVS